MHSIRKPVAAAAAGLLAMLGSIAGHAQSAATTAGDDATLEEVVVTGSRIRGAGPVGSNVIAVTSEEVARTGLLTTDQLLRSMPQVSNLGLDDSRTGGAQRAISNLFAASAVNLRGLGVEATLSLLDGRRTTRSGEGRIFDMNTIPAIALQRIEVVADGASAIYGSDAVTGVVNLVPHHKFDGVVARINFGSTNGLHQYGQSVLGGFAWGSGNAVLAYEHYNRSNLPTSARPLLYNDSINTSGLTGTSTSANPGNIVVGGVQRPIADSNSDGRISAGEYAAALANGTPNRQSNWKGVDALPAQRRNSIFAYAEQRIGERATLYGEAYYSKRDFVRLSAAPTNTSLSVPATNFYNQSGVAGNLAINYSFINDVGNTRAYGYEKSHLLTTGLKYELGHEWQTEAYYTFGQVQNYRYTGQQLNTIALTAALSNTTSAAFSPFGGGHISPQATIDSFNGYTLGITCIKLKNGALKADGPVFSMPGGEVRLAAGLEYLSEVRPGTNLSTASSPTVSTGDFVELIGQNRKVTSAFLELFVPLFGTQNARPGLQQLLLSLAGRTDKYDDSAGGQTLLATSTSNPKIGLTWQPVDDLKVRASYGKSFRAPSLGDYGLGAPTFQAAAAYAAVPHVAGLFGLPPQPVAAVAIQGGRNDGALTPEKANTFSIGFDYSPAAVRGLNLGVTYYNIDYKNQIQTPADSTSLNNADYATALRAAGLVTVNPTTAQVQQYLAWGGIYTQHIGPPSFLLYGTGSAPAGPQSVPIYLLIDSRSTNGGEVKTKGFDISARYSRDSSWGTWTVSDASTIVTSFEQSLLPGTPLIDYLNTFNNPLKFVTRAQFGWQKRQLSANLFANYTNSYTNTQVSPNVSIAAYKTFDLTLAYETGTANSVRGFGGIRVQLNAQNLADSDPPYALVGNPAQRFDTQNASAIGRLVSLTIEKKW
jgi:iron complex outermembrane receptor protein